MRNTSVFIILLIIIVIYIYYMVTKIEPSEALFYTTTEYPKLKILEDNWKVIASEIPYFDINKSDKFPKRSRSAWMNAEGQNLIENMKSEWVQGWQGKNIWYNFPLMYNNNVIDQADKICPQTINLLKQIDSIQIAGYSLLLPHSKLSIHTDTTGKKYNSIASNFLLTPNNANVYIKNNSGKFVKYKHKLGKIVLFDATDEHYADNDDDQIRVILYIDLGTNSNAKL